MSTQAQKPHLDSNGTTLKINDWVLGEKGQRAQLQNIRGVTILKYLTRGIVLSKVDTTKLTKIEAGSTHDIEEQA